MRIDETVCALKALNLRSAPPRVALGFDGYLDRIARRVSDGGAGFHTMADFGARLSVRDGLSSSFSLEETSVQLGGNMPNTALALKAMGMKLICVGALGCPEPDAAFAQLLDGIDWISYADPGFCLAVEFSDCKLFLADGGELGKIDYEELVRRVGRQRLLQAFDGTAAICLLNWGEIGPMQSIWRGMAEDVLEHLCAPPEWILADTADLTARTGDEVRALFDTFRLIRRRSKLVLSINDGELQSIATALSAEGKDMDALLDFVYALDAVDALVLHTARFASVRSDAGARTLATRHAESPVLLTGAGDHFNAGLLTGLLAGVPVSDCLAVGNAASSAYVHNGISPSIKELIDEMRCCEGMWQGGKQEVG